MRITLNIDEKLLIQAKLYAAKEHISLTRLIEESLSLRLRTIQALPVYAGHGGLRPTVIDSLSHRALLDAADET